MAQPRPTHEVFRQDAPTPSYDKFIPAQSQHPSRDDHVRPANDNNATSVDRLEQLRKDDEAYLEHIAQSRRNDAHEELQREQREVEQFRRERASVKRRVDVAQGVRGRYEQPLIGRLGLANIVKKRRVERDKNDQKDIDSEKQLADGETKERMGAVALVSGYSSSSEEEGDNSGGDERGEADERSNSGKDDG